MKKELEFECWDCWDKEKNSRLIFKTDDWDSFVGIDECGIPYVNIQTRCPRCNSFLVKEFTLDYLLRMIFEIEEKLEKLEGSKLIK
ncbi:MAG: hypothetical protein KAX49_11765 [Halanaerobiales bacterium]|nr:hypothetical protein [Halanaerobiales bacterium]